VSIARLTSLTELEVARNNISALLPEIHVLTKLVWLNVFSNPVKKTHVRNHAADPIET
jgi:Leucine-rich repeat (LRR) protein